MRHRVHTFKIGRTSAHRKAMLANMISSLIENGSIRTTMVKAKEARRFADRMVTLGKKGTLHHRRQAISFLRDKDAVKKLFDEIAPTFAERNGGYTRIMLLGTRQGDGAEMCILQFTNNDEVKKKTVSAAKSSKTEDMPVNAEVENTEAEKSPASAE
ncbi:MAG: 50S ribosomal protein L17 [Lentisphaerae bacterium]|nr:50S ribosomal protein L17 [Lentisphaerota bacterium]